MYLWQRLHWRLSQLSKPYSHTCEAISWWKTNSWQKLWHFGGRGSFFKTASVQLSFHLHHHLVLRPIYTLLYSAPTQHFDWRFWFTLQWHALVQFIFEEKHILCAAKYAESTQLTGLLRCKLTCLLSFGECEHTWTVHGKNFWSCTSYVCQVTMLPSYVHWLLFLHPK